MYVKEVLSQNVEWSFITSILYHSLKAHESEGS